MNKNDEINFLRMRRKQLKLKMQQVADYLEVSKSAICQYECFKSSLSRYKIDLYHEFIKNRQEVTLNEI